MSREDWSKEDWESAPGAMVEPPPAHDPSKVPQGCDPDSVRYIGTNRAGRHFFAATAFPQNAHIHRAAANDSELAKPRGPRLRWNVLLCGNLRSGGFVDPPL